MLRHLRLYKSYLSMAIKTRLMYKADSIISMVSFVITNAVNFATMYLILSNVPSIGTWNFARIVFVYGLGLIPKGIDHMFTDRLWALGISTIKRGDLDRYMTKPVNVLFQINAEEFKTDGIGEVLLGIIFIAIFGSKVDINWSVNTIAPLVVAMAFATLVFTAVKLATATIAFWTKDSINIMDMAYGFSNYTMYPLRWLGKGAMIIMCYIVPFGAVIYLPSETLFAGGNMWASMLVNIAVSVGCIVLAYMFWLLGLSKYESAGS